MCEDKKVPQMLDSGVARSLPERYLCAAIIQRAYDDLFLQDKLLLQRSIAWILDDPELPRFDNRFTFSQCTEILECGEHAWKAIQIRAKQVRVKLRNGKPKK